MAMTEHQRAAKQVTRLHVRQAAAEDAALDTARQHAKTSLFSFAKDIIGFSDLTPSLHLPVCDFLTIQTVGEMRKHPEITRHIVKWQEYWSHQPDETKIRKRLVLLPRGHFKSSLISIAYPLWKLINNPNWCLLQSSSKVDNSEHFTSRQRRLWESWAPLLALFHDLKPDTGKVKWTDAEYVIRRERDTVEMSVTATGVGGGIASRHYDEQIFDDLINETMIDSPEELRRVKQWFDYSEHALGHPEQSMMTGAATLWPCEPDISVYIMDHRPEFMVYKRAAIENGQPIFPERCSMAYLLRLQQRDPKAFACNMMNEPRGGGFTEFDETWLQKYAVDGDDLVKENGQRVSMGRLNIYPMVDPAIAEKPGSSAQNAIVVTGVDTNGDVYLLEAWAAHCSPTDVVWQIVEYQRRYNPAAWYIEDVAYQKALKHFVEYVCEKEDLDIRVEPVRPDSTKSKTARIRGLEPYFRQGRFFVHPSMVQFIDQVANFPMAGKLIDLLDACAYGPQVWQAPLSDDELAELDDDLEEWSIMAGRSMVTGY